jgi:hypothetical protein
MKEEEEQRGRTLYPLLGSKSYARKSKRFQILTRFFEV